MKVKDQLLNDLLQYPSIVKNKWSAYNQWFCISEQMEWVNGELIDKEATTVYKTKKEDIEHAFDVFRENIELNGSLFTFPHDLENLQHKVELIAYTSKRITDFTQTEELYEISKNSPICNVPVDVKEDWQAAIDEFFTWLCEHKDQLSEDSKKILSKKFCYEL